MFRDDLGVLTRRRTTYQWYPDDIWRWMIASQWHLIGNAEPLLARTIETEDVRGAHLLTATRCQLTMEMAYLQQRRYRPYAKWFGHGLRRAPDQHDFGPPVGRGPHDAADPPLRWSPSAGSSSTRRRAQSVADQRVRRAGHRGLRGGRERRGPAVPGLNTAAFIDATVEAITDPGLRSLPRVRAIDQLTHHDDQLINFTAWPERLADTYRRMLADATPLHKP